MNEIQIYGGIGAEGWDDLVVGAADVKAMLDEIGDAEKITVRLNSPGGDVFEGIAIYNLLTQHSAEIEMYIDGWAASAASIIACAGDTVVMGTGAQIMIHNPWTIVMGEAKDFRAEAAVLDGVKESLIEIYQSRVKATSDDLSAWMDSEKWIRTAEAQEIGFADETTESIKNLRSLSNCKWIRTATPPDADADAVAHEIEKVKLSACIDSRSVHLDYLAQTQRIAVNAKI